MILIHEVHHSGEVAKVVSTKEGQMTTIDFFVVLEHTNAELITSPGGISGITKVILSAHKHS